MEEYIRKLLEQVRFQKAHKAIEDEIRSHIEDQTEAYILDGMDKETAEKRAVRGMGDPVEAGISLDSVHRPQIAWDLVIAAFVVAFIGIGLTIIFANNYGFYGSHSMWYINKKIKNTVIGAGLMIILYLIDYTTVAKYSKFIGLILMAVSIVYGIDCYRFWYDVQYNGPTLQRFCGIPICNFLYLASRLNRLKALMIPLYAGILYKHKGQKNNGFIMALIWIIVAGSTGFYDEFGMGDCMLTGIMLVQLTLAIKKEWIKVKKIPALISVWFAFMLFLTCYIRNYTDIVHITYADIVSDGTLTRRLLGSARMLGHASKRVPVTIDNILTVVSLLMGIIVALVVIVAVVAVIVIGLMAVSKTRNQLGNVMGIGCVMWLTLNTIRAVLVGFGVLPDYWCFAFLPFISGETDIIVSYIMLGILLSIYKYKDAYAEHVDIKIRKESKELEV